MVGSYSMGPGLPGLSEPDFRISFYESYYGSSNFAQYRYFTKFKWPYFTPFHATVTWWARWYININSTHTVYCLC